MSIADIPYHFNQNDDFFHWNISIRDSDHNEFQLFVNDEKEGSS